MVRPERGFGAFAALAADDINPMTTSVSETVTFEQTGTASSLMLLAVTGSGVLSHGLAARAMEYPR